MGHPVYYILSAFLTWIVFYCGGAGIGNPLGNIQFFTGDMEIKRKQDKNILTFPNGNLNPGFLYKFPLKIWILREIRSINLTVLKRSWFYFFLIFLIFSFRLLKVTFFGSKLNFVTLLVSSIMIFYTTTFSSS